MKSLSLVIHAHFYQPPRENPWTQLVDPEPSAAPDHDWNSRITRECYQPLADIQVGDDADAPRVNAYEYLSFNVGPTLLDWLEREKPRLVESMRAGDRAGARRLGHGNAIAMPYHHIIMPLASRRDKVTEVRWGVRDFRRRFGREPSGMWLPETAVDSETLEVLAAEGIAFTILAPHQVREPPADGMAGVARVGTRSIALFVYDGPLSHGVAFGGLLRDSEQWEHDMLHRRSEGLTSLATDGETFGHHHKFGDLALGAIIHRLSTRRGVRLENYASVLAARPPVRELKLVEPSSWSCAHGVERWRSNCGCRISDGTQQEWRTPLREAIDWLVAEIHRIYERADTRFPDGAWPYRDAAGATGPVPGAMPAQQRLVEMERSALKALTSCGWFFDDFAGLEGRQVLRYAAHAISLAGEEGRKLERGFLERLEKAASNDKSARTAREFYLAQASAGHGAGSRPLAPGPS